MIITKQLLKKYWGVEMEISTSFRPATLTLLRWHTQVFHPLLPNK